MAAPSLATIRAQVAVLRDKNPEARVFGIYAPSIPDLGTELRLNGETLVIARCDSVLAVRERLATLRDGDPRLVLVTSLNDADLGSDVAARFKLVPINLWQLVKERFKARHVDPRLSERHGWVAEALVDVSPQSGFAPIASGFLDAETVWRALFQELLGIENGARDPESLLTWSLVGEDRERLARLPSARRVGLTSAVRESAGDVAGRIFECLAGAHATHALSIGLVARVLHGDGADRDADATRAAVRLERFVGDSPLPAEQALAWADAAEAVIRRVLTADPFRARALLAAADSFLERELAAPATAHRSLFLPQGLAQCVASYARALESNLECGSPSPHQLWELARPAFEHELTRSDPDSMEPLRMSLRLAGWVASQRSAEAPSSFADAAREHRQLTSFVDWARRRLADPGPAELQASLIRLSAVVGDVREERNRHFGRLLAGWCKAGSHDASLVLVEDVLDRVVAPLAKRLDVLLVVIDGMDVAAFRELQQDLTGRGFVEQVPRADGATFAGLAPVIAAFPTVTQVSRTSLFCGRLAIGAQAQERDCFAKHTSLRAARRTGQAPVLFHKATLHESGAGTIAAELRSAVLASDRPVVGVVINAIDDHLAKGEQVRVVWDAQTIRPLAELLDCAAEAGRAIVLVSDHGHVLERGTAARPGDGERWRQASTPAAADEVLLEGPRVLLGDAHRAIAPWSERVRFGAKKNGYHGGASPQEVIIPLGVFTRDGVTIEGWIEAPPELPVWWDEPEAPIASAVLTPAPPARVATPPHARPGEQASLFPPRIDAAPVEPTAVRAASWIDQLLASPLLAQQREMAARTVLHETRLRALLVALDERGGKLTRSAIARQLGVAPMRIGPIISALRRLLNVDGFAVIAVDEGSDTIELNRDLLKRQFEL